MTGRQTAIAAGADLKWLTNSASLLRRPVRYDPREAKWWGLVHLLVVELGLSLKSAAKNATAALKNTGRSASDAIAGNRHSDLATIVIDVSRYESIFLANLSRALVHETPRRRGRTKIRREPANAVDAARAYGIDIGLVEAALKRSPAERLETLEQNAAFLREMRATRR